MEQHNSSLLRMLSGFCPDEACKMKLYFPPYDSSVECINCGQRHQIGVLQNVSEVQDAGVALHNLAKSLILDKTGTCKRGPEMVKVLGLSNYHCKLLSPILTSYGMERVTERPKLLKDMNQAEVFNTAVLADRAFLIDHDHINIVGYGIDISGSQRYLEGTLAIIKQYNNNLEHLIPIHADGDGHCLVHAVSRALVGRELFWHSLRCNLKSHISNNLSKYKELFSDFIDVDEWQDIIDECDPNFQPKDGEPLGLRNIHVFGLANVLHRPIILLDSLTGMQSCGDYAALFLPGLVDPSLCRGKSGELNKPLCIAWSSASRNHYIPLVAVKNAQLPVLPRCMLPKAWGVPQSLINQYIDFDENDSCVIGGDKCLQDQYVLKLSSAMDQVFMQRYRVHPELVADVHFYLYWRTGVVGIQPSVVIEKTQRAVEQGLLYRCLRCDAICERRVSLDWLIRGGLLYNQALQHGPLQTNRLYKFPLNGVTCSYDADKDELVPDQSRSVLEQCQWCQTNHVRKVRADGSIEYRNGDRTKTPAQSTKCTCGFKHYWDGKEYDNQPLTLPITLSWNGQVIGEKVAWFDSESDLNLNSNVYQIASELVLKHFPGVFGIERLTAQVVDQILEQTRKESPEEKPVEEKKEDVPSKIILSGYKTVHKEELTKSEAEKMIQQRITANASIRQTRSNTPPKLATADKVSAGSSIVPKSRSQPAVDNPQYNDRPGHSAKMIRVVTSDGRQLRLPVETPIVFGELLNMLEENLSIPRHRQKIKYGFPPKELLFSDEQQPLDLKPGDKITVEIIPDLDTATPTLRQDVPTPATNSSLCDSNTRTTEMFNREVENLIITTLNDLQNGNIEDSDAAITSLMLTSTLTGRSVWPYIQRFPRLFSKGGALYNQMMKDVGLEDGKHCTLPLIPDKSFRYSADNDRLELCMEPLGHFAVEPRIEEKVRRMERTGSTDHESSVMGGMVISRSSQQLTTHVPFHGKGYTLGGSKPADDTGQLVEVEPMDTSSTTPVNLPAPSPMIRMGPGFSVLNSSLVNTTNSAAEMFNKLASNIEEVIEIVREASEACEETETMQAETSHPVKQSELKD